MSRSDVVLNILIPEKDGRKPKDLDSIEKLEKPCKSFRAILSLFRFGKIQCEAIAYLWKFFLIKMMEIFICALTDLAS